MAGGAAVIGARDVAGLDEVDPAQPLVFVDLDAGRPDQPWVPPTGAVAVGVTRHPVDPAAGRFAAELACTLAPSGDARWAVAVPDVDAAVEQVAALVGSAPGAAAVLPALLRLTEAVPVRDGLVAESLAYSMLLAGPEFRAWRAARPIRATGPAAADEVIVERDGGVLTVTLNRPQRRNSFSRSVRDRLVEVLDVAVLDASVTQVGLRARGPAFCSGGDLDEFGTAPDVVAAHAARTIRSVAARIDAVRDRVHVHLHGACIGAGIELPSFAGRVTARDDLAARLPELSLGLVPGAGGTVGVTRRIGRWRCAYLVLSGAVLDAPTALQWGLIDAITDE